MDGRDGEVGEQVGVVIYDSRIEWRLKKMDNIQLFAFMAFGLGGGMLLVTTVVVLLALQQRRRDER